MRAKSPCPACLDRRILVSVEMEPCCDDIRCYCAGGRVPFYEEYACPRCCALV